MYYYNCLVLLDQLNTTTHGTVKTTPYELVFGQPPRQCIFPTVDKPCILEEHIEDLLEGVCCVKKALFIIMFSLYYIDNEDLLSSSGNVSGDDDDKDIDDKGLCGNIDYYSATCNLPAADYDYTELPCEGSYSLMYFIKSP